jgi:hypothetical protein
MTDLAVIVPTRGRPENIRRLIETWASTGATSTLWFGIDNDDESIDLAALGEWIEGDQLSFEVRLTSGPHTSMATTLNDIAMEAIEEFPFVGFAGDDHLPRTTEWDRRIFNHLANKAPAIVYANDLMQGINLPSAVFMSSAIPRALGYFCPPQFRHLYIDDVWKAWGLGMEGLHRYIYLPDVIVEHVHPQAHKADWDAGYERVNSGEMWEHDKACWDTYQMTSLDIDIKKIRGLT